MYAFSFPMKNASAYK